MLYLFLQFVYIFLLSTSEAGRRIFDGQDAAVGEFPYVASWGSIETVDRRQTYFDAICTCSILSPTWTLSAAHCMETPPTLTRDIIYYGSHEPTHKGNFSKVLEAIAHPNYDFDSPFVNNDICLVRTSPIEISAYGVLSAIDYKSLIGQEVFVAGHGITNDSSKVDVTFDVNKPLQVFKGAISRCLEHEDEEFYSICVSSPCGSLAMICGGDSGGPMIHASGIVGVNSWSRTDCEQAAQLKKFHKHTLAQASSGVISPISPFIDWVSRTIASVPSI